MLASPLFYNFYSWRVSYLGPWTSSCPSLLSPRVVSFGLSCTLTTPGFLSLAQIYRLIEPNNHFLIASCSHRLGNGNFSKLFISCNPSPSSLLLPFLAFNTTTIQVFKQPEASSFSSSFYTSSLSTSSIDPGRSRASPLHSSPL